jgi:hypothetical protein
MGPSSYALRGMSDLLISIDLYEIRLRKDHRGVDSNFRCAAFWLGFGIGCIHG